MVKKKICAEQENTVPRLKVEEYVELWKEFEILFPTDQTCYQKWWQAGSEAGLFRCYYCGNNELEECDEQRLAKCKNCKKKSWFTAGTFFERVRSAKVWMFAIWLLERGVAIASSMLHKITGIAQSSALNLLRKIATVIEAKMGSDAVEIPSSCFSAGIYKRSRETPAREHPTAEEEALNQDKQRSGPWEPQANTSGQRVNPCSNGENIQSNDLTEIERLIFDLLDETPKNIETSCEQYGLSTAGIAAALTMLEFYGLIKILPGGRAVRCKKADLNEGADASFTAEVKLAIADMDAYVLNIHLGVSRKYFQKYAAIYSCIANAEKWKEGRLLHNCLASPLIRYNEMLGYVTALMVKLELR